ncbi:MAG: 1-deoxy-D-xylulose-5-phosphate synthase [Prevotellaceae bacterium]|nr:1-deoxy-D-xylulose-5-phosphate synthase [Prevotellaceae bacterium]
MYIEKIKAPKDVKNLSIEQLETLADEVRDGILNRVSNHGGHVGPNLGITEATVALVHVFDIPEDKVVFDVSHQIYPYKMLTGRAFGYLDEERFDEVSGYSSPSESPVYDEFEIGHTSTSVALATGLQKARDMKGGKENVIAVIGDGSLSGGEAFEGLDMAAEIGTNIIIIVNDNEMSIAENHGGIYRNLKLLRETNGKAELNFFKAMGLDYIYVADGNDINSLVSAFESVKDIDRPIVVHIHTEKGHGFKPAVENKERFHWSMPFELETGNLKPMGDGGAYEYFPHLVGKYLVEKIKNDPLLVSVSSAVPASLGFNPETRKQLGAQYVDVGIAEEEAVALISGIAKGGARPVYSTYATFIQRTYDQLAQDLCVNGNPAVINVIGASVHGMNDITHICFFDIPMLSHIPNLVYLAPTTWEEFVAMEDWAIAQTEYPVAVRIPEALVAHSDEAYDTDYSRLNTFKMAKKGDTVAVIALGDFYQKGEKVVSMLADKGIDATLINPRFVSGLDEEMLESLKTDHKLVITLEDGSIDGGFGERISRFYGSSDMKTINFGVRKALYDRYDVNKLLLDNHLTEEQIVEDVLSVIK